MTPKSTLAILILGLIAARRRGGRQGEAEDHVPGPRRADLPVAVQLVPQRRQAEGRPGAGQPSARRCKGAARARSSSRGTPTAATSGGSSRTPRSRKMPPKADKLPEAELNIIKAWIEGGAPETVRLRRGGQGEAEVRVQARPLRMGKPVGPCPRCPKTSRPSRSSSAPSPNAIVAMASSPWAPAGRRRRPQAGLALSRDDEPPGSASSRSRRGPSTSSSSAGMGPCSWPAAAGAGSRAWRSSSTSRPANGSSRSARSTTSSSPPTSAPIMGRSPWAGRARSSGSTGRPTARSSSR